MKCILDKKIIPALFALCVFMPVIAYGLEIKMTVSNDTLIKYKQTASQKYLTATEAYKLVNAHASEMLFVDVRAPTEIEFVGWASLVDAVIPYLSINFDDWDKKKRRYRKMINRDFSIQFENLVARKGLNKNSPIIFMCRSGSRSSSAASLVAKLGYTQAYTVVDGFEGDTAREGSEKGHRVVNGWKNSGLPWTYKIDGNKVLFNQ